MTLLIALVLMSGTGAAQARPVANPDLREQIACAPTGLAAPPAAGLRVLGGYVHGRIMFGPGDSLIVGGGTAQGIQTGQQYFVRRQIVDAATKQPKTGGLYGVHTAGWVTIVDAKDTMAVATVTHACDGVVEGDFLEPYVEPVFPAATLTGTPDYQHPAHITMADERRQTGYPGLVMLMDRGSEGNVRPGQTLTIYRETVGGNGPIIQVGTATVLSVTPHNALVRVESSHEAIYVGDFVAIHK